MLVREVPFDSFTLALGALFVLVISGVVCLSVAMIWDGKRWSEALIEKVYMRFILPLCAVFVVSVMMSSRALSNQRPAAEGDYEKLGTYTATVARTYPQSQMVEVETDFGVSLPVPESMMPEGAASRGRARLFLVAGLLGVGTSVAWRLCCRVAARRRLGL